MRRSIAKLFLSILVAVFSTTVAINAISPMLFGSMGKTTASTSWNYILALYIVLALIAPLSVVGQSEFKHRAISCFAKHLTAILAGALLGFYYGGIRSNHNPQIALLSAIILGATMAILNGKNQFIEIAIVSINTVATYAFALLSGVTAIILFSSSQLIEGISCAIVSLAYIGLTIFHGNLNIKLFVSS